MHPAPAFAQNDRALVDACAAQRGFAVVSAVGERGPVAMHAPVLLQGGVLRFHASGMNPIVAALAARPWALAVVTGPDAYVSPDWYQAADQVPTWNYLAAEIE